jgi:ABC-type Fe3+-siderophore transport system permease subunit
MDRKPITAREALPWIIPGSIVGAGLALAVCSLMGLLSNVIAVPCFSGAGGAFGALIGLKIADVRRRKRP